MNAPAQCFPDLSAPLFKRISSGCGEHLPVVPHSRIYDLSPDLAARNGREIALSNLAIALKQLHRGASAPYPCWARYLCSSGCHQEKAARDKPSCDFIRGWLEFCLHAYCDLIVQRPEYFAERRIVVEEVPAWQSLPK